MNSNNKTRAVVLIFVQGIIVYLIMVYLVVGPLFREFYVGQPAVGQLPFATSYVSLGIAVAYTTIALLAYPVFKYRSIGGSVEE